MKSYTSIIKKQENFGYTNRINEEWGMQPYLQLYRILIIKNISQQTKGSWYACDNKG